MENIKYFKTTLRTKRFSKNQIVWILFNHANHLEVRFKFRDKGRYVNGYCDKSAKYIGEIKEMEVEDSFYNRLHGLNKK
jgi:hypothetical protein